MKTVILFSSLFYLIGLKIGSTLEGIKNSILPSGHFITAPFKKSENSDKNYQFKPEKEEAKPEKQEESAVEKDSGTSTEAISNKVLRKD
jgi:hypothetical protein